MKKLTVIIVLLISVCNLIAQEIKFRENINKDSLFNISLNKVPKEMREEVSKNFKAKNEKEKEFLLYMISMPESSKKELIENYENKKSQIENLKNEYLKLIPKNYIVDIELKPASKILTIDKEITIKIYQENKSINDKNEEDNIVKRNDRVKVISEDYHLKPNSKELENVLKSINWTDQTLSKIERLLDEANCISIENGKITTIGFARSGMGLYSYKIFENQLTAKDKQEYNKGCEYIFYKDNIVLEYGGGAIGSQCFEKTN